METIETMVVRDINATYDMRRPVVQGFLGPVQRIANPRVVPLAWVRTALEEQEETLGRDPWAYGLTPANRNNLETVLRYTFEQGMISKMLPLDALFADTDLGDAGGSDGI